MYFLDYVSLIRKFYKKSIAQYDLCTTLCDFVIVPADIRNEKGDVLVFDKGYASRMVRGEIPIHGQIRDHIYDNVVMEAMVKNFQEVIVPELNPEYDDLCFRMMQLLEKDNISPSRLADFKMLANASTLGPFLAKTFIYVIVENSDNKVKCDSEYAVQKNDYKSNILIKGIDKGNLVDKAVCESFTGRIRITKENIIDTISSIYNEINHMHLEKKNKSDDFSPYKITITGIVNEPYKIEGNDEKLIRNLADILNIKLSKDFFDLGNLEKNILGMSAISGAPDYRGTAEEKRKVETIFYLLEKIKKANKLLPYLTSFENAQCISLAVVNEGTDFDEDVIVDLEFHNGELLTAEEISKYDEAALRYLIRECDYESQFEIQRGLGYVDYDESRNSMFDTNPYIDSNLLYQYGQQDKLNYIEEVKDLLGYYYCEKGDGHLVEVKIDKINQHTGVAFPTVILVNPGIKNIKYTIKSKYNPSVIEGMIEVD